jgi:acetyltransferase-like isoleucine patch superfamily enzyme
MIFNRLFRFLHYRFLKLIKPEMIGFANQVRISNLTHISNQNNHLKLGNNIFIGHHCYIDANNAEVIIEDNAQITNYVNILTHSSHLEIRFPGIKKLAPQDKNRLLKIESVKIGQNSYIGPHTTIMPGTQIGKGCIISAHSYVSGNIPDYSIVRGIPGKIIGNTLDMDNSILEEFPSLRETYYLTK